MPLSLSRGPRRVAELVAVLLLCGVAASGVAASGVAWKPVGSCGRFHFVVSNDSWSRVAVQSGVAKKKLYRLNRASASSLLRVGDRVCVAAKSVATTSTSSTSTSTTPSTSTTTPTNTPTTTVVASPSAPVLTVGALVACQRVSVSWSGAVPDTGLYSVQWVRVSAAGTYDFNSYSMFNVRGTSTELPNWFNPGATYAMRVYGMRADWDGIQHINQNVTPQSTVVTFSVPSCTPAVRTYSVGDTGPGGGIVFYVASSNFTSTGSDCGTSCKYLEAAPTDISGTYGWCSNTGSSLNVTATGIGTGMANTTTADTTCTSGAIQQAADYTNNSKTDWHLSSKDELNELCKYARTQTTGDTSVVCANSGSLRTGFAAGYYWSSSEVSASNAWGQYFDLGNQSSGGKTSVDQVRPVRAFG